MSNTELLAAYEAAVEARDEAADAVEEIAVNAELVAEADFDIEDAEDYIEDAKDVVVDLRGELEGARATEIADGFNTASLNETFGGRNATDARLQQLVDAAQAAVRNDAQRYTVEVDDGDATVTAYERNDDGDFVQVDDADAALPADAEVFSARQLQSQLNAANSTLAGDITRNGETLTIASNLSDAIGAFLAQNSDIATGTGSLQAVRDAYLAVVEDIRDNEGANVGDLLDGNSLLATWYDAVNLALNEAFGDDADFEDRSTIVRANADEDLSAGVVNGLLALNTRFANEERVELREDIFRLTDVGSDYLDAVDRLEAREEAIQELADAQAVVEALETAFAEYQDAVAAVAEAAEALGFEVITVDDGILFGEADEAELFVFNASDLDDLSITDVTVNDLEAGDALFFGTDYALGGETGDNNALEFFVTTNVAGDVVIEVENTAFGSVQDDVYTVTLTGISEDQLNINGGVVSIVEVA
ncbi:MAG: hypothetical protein Q8S08_14345 [Halomonas sp.]|nr:hypothetical protein [Halomonas sp.]MDP3536558.1 hypothetical protein [Halomonas sp.]